MKLLYTVVGYYADNDEPFIGHKKAESPAKASELCQRGRPDLRVVEVVEGWHVGKLCNDMVIP